ncbi:DUF6259 domain-containing protein [Paenibacillus montanisoli]|uniref:DUF6259 domain-containing protein n=1 Tax=Paenibacillus montanisoli TaxID=2081970 RepID=A0A328U411_9BACL|nr:DUF6259 domain-containing protein [Paenibacillus montanisoli]RAP77538.1 hypothetical protein DL346_03405 [Paenibacillus montanisoli]
MIVLENKRIRLELSEETGAVCALRDAFAGIDYITGSAGCDAFRLETDDGFSGAFASFSYSLEPSEPGGKRAHLVWQTGNAITVSAEIWLAAGEGGLQFRCSADNGSPVRLLSLEYPVLPDFGTITDEGLDDYVAHSFATGVKVRNPLKHFETGGKGLRFMPYPESFSGASMQFFTYYGLNRCGIYFAAVDGDGHPKWLNFYKNDNGLLEASFIHGCQDMGPGKGVYPPYAIVVEPTEGRDWYEAADRYRGWAEKQKWCAKGPLAERPETAAYEWLYKDMGVATFGINAGSDRTAWLKAYHETIGTGMFHVLGPDWTNAPQTFYKGFPGGFDDWFPTRFNEANLAYIKEAGDKFAPFEFDYLYHFEGADGDLGRAAAQKFPDLKKSIDGYKFPFLCPAHPYAHDFHVRRDAELQRVNDVDAIYYDISANNILKICMDDSHGHPVGAGRLIEEAYRQNYADTKIAMASAAGRYVPMGTEMMNETMLGLIDYYQARAGGQPAAPLELWPIRELLKSGDAELIPMFAYVYQEYGAVRMDGWGKLVEEIGQLYFFTVARTYLWGGLYELNYEYSPMEALNGGLENAPEEHYYPFEARGYAFSERRAAYLGAYAKLRVGAANKYWAYGRMLRPLEFETSRIRMDWFHYNHGKETPEYNNAGELEVDAVIHSAWTYKGESTGLFFANVSEQAQKVKTKLATYLPGADRVQGSVTVRLFGAGEHAEQLDIAAASSGELEFDIPARCAAMIELTV